MWREYGNKWNLPTQQQIYEVNPSKLDASVLDLMGIKSHCYADMFTFHTNTSSVSIYYSVFMIQSIFRMVSVIKLPG